MMRNRRNLVEMLEARALLSVTLNVPATSDPWLLGGLNVGNSVGTAPISYTLPAGQSEVLNFTQISGSISRTGFSAGGPDGQNFNNTHIDLNSVGGISGIVNNDPNHDFALLAVFTGNTVPTGSAPATQNYTSIQGQSSFSPLLDQVFFVGDGLTGTGAGVVQAFHVPTGATKVSFGFADLAAAPLVNIPGSFGDNTGVVTLTITTISHPPIGQVPGTVFNDTNGNGKQDLGETGIPGVTVYLDINKNGKLDRGEPTVTTKANGTYNYSDVPPGTYQVREVLPLGATATSTQPVTVTVTAGSVTVANFGNKISSVITGTVFNDTNGNGVKDTGETGIANVVVYIDANTNGVLDSFDTKTTTNSSGNYSFTVPFGTYTIREVVPAGDTLTTAIASFTLPLGETITKNFGNKLG